MPHSMIEPSLLIRLRPTGPWRMSGDSGRKDELNVIFPADRVYSAVSAACAQLGELDAWLAATSGEATKDGSLPAVRFTSMFPFFGRQLYAPPPVTLWPPPQASTRMQWDAAKLIPLGVIDELLAGESFKEDRWEVDGLSGCLLPSGSQTPFRERTRSTAPVDRLSGASERSYDTGCIEFNQGGGLWLLAVYAGEDARNRWETTIRAAFRLLADSGFGGERSRGWGRSEQPEYLSGHFPQILLDNVADPGTTEGEHGHWLLSTFVPASTDHVDWKSGFYHLKRRNGRVESHAGWGAEKKSLNMVREGSVLVAEGLLQGAAVDVAPEGFAHPVWRAGYAVAAVIPWKAPSFQLPLPPAKPEVPAPSEASAQPIAGLLAIIQGQPEPESEMPMIYEANIVEEPVVVEMPRFVDEDPADVVAEAGSELEDDSDASAEEGQA